MLDFGLDKSVIEYIGCGLQRPECIPAERDGTLSAAEARAGVVRIAPDGTQQIVAQKHFTNFAGASNDAARYLEGTLPNGLAFAANGDILVSNFGTERLEVMRRDGETRVLADNIDGVPIGKVNFVLLDSRMASMTFGGPDLRTVYVGSVKGTRIPCFRSPVAGLPMVHWNKRSS
jgi:sugar lactone lactonase YvrE